MVKHFPLLADGFQLVTGSRPPQGGVFVPALDSTANIPDDVTFFYYNGPTVEGFTHGYFYERRTDPAVYEDKTYTIPPHTKVIEILQDGLAVPRGIYTYIENYPQMAEVKERFNNEIKFLFMRSESSESSDGQRYELPYYGVAKEGDIVWNRDTYAVTHITAVDLSNPNKPKFTLDNDAVVYPGTGAVGSYGYLDPFVSPDDIWLFAHLGSSSEICTELREYTIPGYPPECYGICPAIFRNGPQYRYYTTTEESTVTVHTLITPERTYFVQTDTQPRDTQKTKLSEFIDDLGEEPAHTHKQYSTHEETKKSINDIIMMNEDWFSYGIEFDTTVSSPTCTRIGNMALHRECPIQNNMRGCLLDDNGKVVKYLNPTDWRGEVRDGSQGQVMVEIPSYYAKFETVGTKRRVRLSEYALKDYIKIPVRYVSAYEAALERSTGKLASVVNLSEGYRGGDNTAAWDGTYRSLLGMPASVMSRTAYRNAAKARNTSINNWTCYLYQVNRELYWLFAVEYATLNSQANYTTQRTPEGYAQGGLGQGVDNWNWDVWGNWNNHNPFVECGFTDEYGNATGVKNHTSLKADGSTLYISPVPRYHGIENPFGHIWKWCDGINIRINPGDGLSECFVSDDPTNFSDSGYNGYSYIGNEARTDGYIKDIIFGDRGETMPTAVGGSNTTYYCDYHHTNIPTATQLRGLLLGGSAHLGTYCGFVYSYSSHVPSNTWTNVGSRLCFITN